MIIYPGIEHRVWGSQVCQGPRAGVAAREGPRAHNALICSQVRIEGAPTRRRLSEPMTMCTADHKVW